MKAFKEEILHVEGEEALRFLVNQLPGEGLMTLEHWHDNYEILYIVDGVHRQSINRQDQIVHPGDVVIIEPGDLHTTRTISQTGGVIFVLQFFPAALNFDNTGGHSRYLDAFLDSGSLRSGYLMKPYAFEKEIERVASKISEEYALRQRGYSLVVKGLVYEFLGYLGRNGEVVQFRSTNDTRLQKVLDICRYVEERYASPPSLADTAHAFGYTPEHLSRLFREITGKTFKAYVDFVRIEEAKRLLRYEKKTVTETAELLGYGSIASFHRAFKRVTGGNPSIDKAL